MPRCVWSVSPTSKPMSRCLPLAANRGRRGCRRPGPSCAPPGRACAAAISLAEQSPAKDRPRCGRACRPRASVDRAPDRASGRPEDETSVAGPEAERLESARCGDDSTATRRRARPGGGRMRPSRTSPASAVDRHARPSPASSNGAKVSEGPAAALEVEHELAVDEHDVGAGAPARAARCGVRRRAATAGPRRTGWAGSAAASEQRAGDPARRGAPGSRRAARSRSTAPAMRELGAAQALDEVAAPNPAALLHLAEDRVDGPEPAGDALGDDSVARDDPVALEQGRRQGGAPLGRRWCRVRCRAPSSADRVPRRATSGQQPPAVPCRVPGPPRALRVGARPRRGQRRARSGANVSLLTSPAQTRSQSASRSSRSVGRPLPVRRGGREAAADELAVERRRPRREVGAQAPRAASHAARRRRQLVGGRLHGRSGGTSKARRSAGRGRCGRRRGPGCRRPTQTTSPAAPSSSSIAGT